MCCARKIGKNHTDIHRSTDHSHIGQLMKEFFSDELPPPGKHRNNMCLSGLAVHHPAYEMILEYATGGCPVNTGHNWTKEEIHAAVVRGPNDFALAD